jgi:hypothetical protein
VGTVVPRLSVVEKSTWILTAKGAKDAKKFKLNFAILAFFAVKYAPLCLTTIVRETTVGLLG